MTNMKLSQPQRAALARVILSERQGFGAFLPGGRFAASCRALERAGLVRLDLARTVEAYLPTPAGLAAGVL